MSADAGAGQNNGGLGGRPPSVKEE